MARAPNPPEDPPTPDPRGHALPFRAGDLTRWLLADPSLDASTRDQLAAFSRILAATFHGEFHDRLIELKDLYGPLDPDSEDVDLPGATLPRYDDSDERFLDALDGVLERANYVRLDLDAVRRAIESPNEIGLNYVPNLELFEHLRFYVRGTTTVVRTIRTAGTRFRRREIRYPAYRRLVLALKFREDTELDPMVRADVVYLRIFKDVPHVDMEMHLPEQGTRVRMRRIDQAQIASPLVMGLGTLAVKAWPAVLAGLALNPVAMVGLLVAPVSAGVNSFFGFQRAKQKHLSRMIRNLYYLTIANNASVLGQLIDTAEDQEFKETLLAYHTLLHDERLLGGCPAEALDHHVETLLRDGAGVDVDFEVHDAVAKLLRLGLAREDPPGRLHPTPVVEALGTLDRRWDDTFQFAPPRPDAEPPPETER